MSPLSSFCLSQRGLGHWEPLWEQTWGTQDLGCWHSAPLPSHRCTALTPELFSIGDVPAMKLCCPAFPEQLRFH